MMDFIDGFLKFYTGLFAMPFKPWDWEALGFMFALTLWLGLCGTGLYLSIKYLLKRE